MAIRIKSRPGESTEQMLRRFKKLCEKEGLTKDIKRKAYYEKPSERKRRSARKSFKRVTGVPMTRTSPGSRSSKEGAAGSGGGGGGRTGGGRTGGRPSGRPSGGRPSGGRSGGR